MWPTRQDEHQRLSDALLRHAQTTRAMPGIAADLARETLAWQFVASLRREDYYRRVQEKKVAAAKADPNSGCFDAERAVVFHLQNNDVEEAAWLIFLMTHFARPSTSGWQRLQDVYGMLGKGIWDWKTVTDDPKAMIDWLAKNRDKIRGKFGNHRKYETLHPDSHRSFGRVLNSYLAWIGAAGHKKFFADVVRAHGNNPGVIFDALFNGMKVTTFGRLARFDYLSLIGRYQIAPIGAASAYLKDATGPAAGARLLFLGSGATKKSDRMLQAWLDDLDKDVGVGMAVMEDALCNWQKSPAAFVHYKG
ncbi:alpha-glutamyl/putrescinyl thymine pyrophosphorylase clade 3 protein [Agrobacterium deltaense]